MVHELFPKKKGGGEHLNEGHGTPAGSEASSTTIVDERLVAPMARYMKYLCVYIYINI